MEATYDPGRLMYIVHNAGSTVPYENAYNLFEDLPDALAFARFLGYENPFGMPLDLRPGIENFYTAGGVKVVIVAVEPE